MADMDDDPVARGLKQYMVSSYAIVCDQCGKTQTLSASNDTEWDGARRLVRMGWVLEHDKPFCDECHYNAAADVVFSEAGCG